MSIFIIVISIVLILMSLLLLIVSPVAGIAGILFGAFGLYRGIKLRKKPAAPQSSELPTAAPVISRPAPVASAPAPVAKPQDSNRKLSFQIKVSDEDIHTKYWKYASKNKDFFMKKSEIVDAGMVDERIFQYTFAPLEGKLLYDESSRSPDMFRILFNEEVFCTVPKDHRWKLRPLKDPSLVESVSIIISGGASKVVREYGDFEEGYRHSMFTDDYPFRAEITITAVPGQDLTGMSNL